MRHFIPSLALLVAAAASAAAGQAGYTTNVYAAPGTHIQVLAADFNHDGKPDLLTYGSIYGEAAPGGALYFNDGTGSFNPPVTLPGSGYLASAVVGDINGDGVPDLIGCVVNINGSSQSSTLTVYRNNGSGTFSILQQIPAVNGCQNLIQGDVNHDGHLDIILGTEVTDPATSKVNNMLTTYFGSATGTLGSPVLQQNLSLDVPSDPSTIFINCNLIDILGADFYQDGQFSLIVNSNCYFDAVNAGTTAIAHGDGTGHFTLAAPSTDYGNLSSGQVADINHDGRLDAIFTNFVGARGTQSLEYFKNNGGGSFTDIPFARATGDPGGQEPAEFIGTALADFNHDGFPDIATSVVADYTQGQYDTVPAIAILKGSATYDFPELEHWLVGADSIGNIVSADFNQDGKPDLAILGFNQNTQTSQLYVYRNAPGSNSCATPIPFYTSTICTPGTGSSVTSPFSVTAASNVLANFTANRIYLDGSPVYESNAQTINTPLTAAPGSHTLVLVSYKTDGTAISTSKTFTVGSVAPAGCIPPAAGVSICAPAPGATAASPVTLTAGALAKTGTITALRAYVDNVAVLTVNNPAATSSFQFSQPVTVQPGPHTLVVVAYQTTGAALTQSASFTVTGAGPCVPTAAGARICSPAPGATSASPVVISAGARASSGNLTAIRLYVDNIAKTTVNNPQQSTSFAVSQSIAVASGTHTLVVVGYNSTGGSVSASETLKVQ